MIDAGQPYYIYKDEDEGLIFIWTGRKKDSVIVTKELGSERTAQIGKFNPDSFEMTGSLTSFKKACVEWVTKRKDGRI